MIRVLHIVTDMNRGGLETMIMNYYRHIDRSRVQFDFLVHRSARAAYDDEIESLGGHIYRISGLNPLSLSYYHELDVFFKEHTEHKIVHSHLDCMSAYPLRAAKKAGVPVRIAHAHSTKQDNDWKYIFKLISKKFITRYSTDLFACSKSAGKWMFGTDNVTVLNNAIDTEKYVFNPSIREEIRQRLELENSAVIGHVGRFSPVKNHDFIIEVFKSVKNMCPNSKLLLIGDGARKNEIQQKVDQLNLSSDVIFVGSSSNVDMYLQAMDVFVFPSHYEGLGIAAVEAQTAGLPCIVSDKVPSDCSVTSDLVSFLPLTAGAEKWAKLVYSKLNTKRTNRGEEVKSCGYDIFSQSIKLEEFYKETYEEQS